MINSYNDDQVPLLDFEKQPKKTRLKPWKRNIIIIASIVTFLVASVVLSWFFVVPKVAQNMANQIEITFTSLTITDPTQDSLLLITKAQIRNPGSISAKATGVNCTIWHNNQAILSLALPDLDLPANNSTDVVLNGTAAVLNQTAFVEFNQDLTRNINVTTIFKLDSQVQALGLTIGPVKIDLEIVLPGFDGLKNTTISDVDISHSTSDEIILYSTMTTYNPTFTTISPLGDLYFGLYYQDAFMGPVVVSNASLAPGANVLHTKAIIKPDNLTIAGEMMSLYFAGESIEISVVGAANSSSEPLFSHAFSGFAINNHIQVEKMELVKSFVINTLALIVDPSSRNSLTLRTDSTITIINPLGDEASLIMQSLVLHDTKVMFAQKLAGFFENFPAVVELTQVAPLSYQAKLNGTLTVDSTFDDFVTSFLSQADVPFALVSKADALSTLSIGNVTVQGVDLNQNVSIKGLKNLQGYMNIDEVSITGGFFNGIQMVLHMTINNPSDAYLDLGRVSLDLFYKGVHMGNSTLPSFIVQPGPNHNMFVQSNFVASAEHPNLAREFLQRYVAGDALQVSLSGASNATDYPYLQSGFSNFTTSLTIPPLNATLVTFALLHFDPILFLESKTIPTNMNVSNPFDTEVQMVGSNVAVLYKNESIAVLNIDFVKSGISIVMPPLSQIMTPQLPVKATTLDLPFKAFWETVYLDVVGELTLYVGPNDNSGYTATIDYAQYHIPATVAKIF
jgi:hypothetical protein